MTKEEIKNYVEDDIAYHCGEFDLPREVAIETVMINIICRYKNGELSKEDLLSCADYLGYTLDVELIDQQAKQEKINREKRREQRRKRRLYLKAIKDVLAHIKIEDVTYKICEVVDEKDNVIYAKCPWCKTKDSLVVSKEKQTYKCSNCGKEGNSIDLVSKKFRLSKKRSLFKLADLFSYTSEALEEYKKETK